MLDSIELRSDPIHFFLCPISFQKEPKLLRKVELFLRGVKVYKLNHKGDLRILIQFKHFRMRTISVAKMVVVPLTIPNLIIHSIHKIQPFIQPRYMAAFTHAK